MSKPDRPVPIGDAIAGYFERHGSRLLTYELHYGGRRIWGATAAVLRNFQDVILDDK